jgi:hypothetical protein
LSGRAKKRPAKKRFTVTLGPPPREKKYKAVVSFRAPREEEEWLEGHVVASGQRLAQVALWAVRLGHEYFRVLEVLHDKVDVLASNEGVSRETMVAKLLQLGLASYERKKK